MLGRVATADVVSLFLVTTALFLFWRGGDRHWRWWLAADFLAYASLLARESNASLYAILFCGAVIRRQRRMWALVSGGSVGLVMYFWCEWLVYGVLFERSAEFGNFKLANLLVNLPYYSVTLLVLIPGGLLAAFLYRGERRAELTLTVAAYLLLFLLWNSGVPGGAVNQLILHAPRFSLSLTALLILALSEVAPRLWKQARESWSKRAIETSNLVIRIGLLTWLAGVLLTAGGSSSSLCSME